MSSKEYMRRYIREYKRESYTFFQEIGLCVRCGLNPPRPGKTRCQACADKENVWQRQERSRKYGQIRV